MITKASLQQVAEVAYAKWRSDPAVFAHDVLGLQTWRRQREALDAIGTRNRVAVRSGHKCGKTTLAAIAALWWVCTRRRARVILTAPSYTQVDELLWAEVKRLHRYAKIKLGGTIGVKPDTGLEFSDGRQIIGFSTDKPERAAGFSSPNMLIVIDEASGYSQKIFEALQGNLAGGATILLISNPTQTSGFYFDAFHSLANQWELIHMSSVECAEHARTDLGVPDGERTGLADPAWCKEMLEAYGPDDPRYQVRVLGNFPGQSEDAMVQSNLVDAAASRWTEEPNDGNLQIGVDVARFGPDWSSIIWSRGLWASKPVRLKGNDNVEVAGRVMEIVRANRRYEREPVTVCIDTSNNGGVADILRRSGDNVVEVIDMVASASAPKGSDYSRLRDAVWGNLRDWLREGGSIPNDERLFGDIKAPKYGFDALGKVKVESKKDMRRRLGRSTDDADALGLSVWRPQAAAMATELL